MLTDAQQRALEEDLAASPKWWSPSAVADLLVGYGVRRDGSYWIALEALRALEDEGKLERLNDGKYRFEWWRWRHG